MTESIGFPEYPSSLPPPRDGLLSIYYRGVEDKGRGHKKFSVFQDGSWKEFADFELAMKIFI